MQKGSQSIASYESAACVVTVWREALRYDTKNGCVGGNASSVRRLMTCQSTDEKLK